MALATNTTAGEIKLAGDLGGSNDGNAPELTAISGVSGSYDLPKLTIDGKGRVVSVTEITGSELTALVNIASTTNHGVVQIDAAGPIDVTAGVITVQDATAAQKGVIRVDTTGGTLAISGGVLSADLNNVPSATTTTLGAVIVPTSGNIDVDGSGNISVPDAGTSTKGVLNVTENDGLTITGGTLTFDLPTASDSVLGGVQVPVSSAIDVDVSGNLTVPDAAVGTKGVVSIQSNGGIDVASGVISATTATGSTLGVVKEGTGLTIAVDGTISADPIPDADDVGTKGLVTIGTGINVSSGTISLSLADDVGGFGIVTIGDNIDVSAGTISVATASGSTTLGLVKSADTDHITITAGAIDVGTDVVLKDVSVTFTAAQGSAVQDLNTVGGDLSGSNVFTYNTSSAMTGGLSNPQTGAWYTIHITNGAGSTTNPPWLTNSNFKWRGGAAQTITTTTNAVDVVTFFVLNATTWLVELSEDYA